MPGPLGRREPPDWRHLERYRLTATTQPSQAVPTVMGTMWPVEADAPERDSRGTWWIGRNGWSGRSRGGHSYCLEAHGLHDSDANWMWFNQVSEGICVSEGVARAAALIYRKRTQPRPLYDVAQRLDEYADTPPAEGTSVRAGFDVWRTLGLWPAKHGETHWYAEDQIDRARVPDGNMRLGENRWATSADDVLEALGTPSRDWVTVLNSWGRLSADGRRGYPHRVRMPADRLDDLIVRYDGEAGIPII